MSFDLPIRNAISKDESIFAAYSLDIKTRAFVKNANLTKIHFNEAYVNKITEEEFYEFCKELKLFNNYKTN